MQFGLINAKTKTAHLEQFDDLWAALTPVGLRMGEIDFGAITRWLHIVVYEHGLYVPADEQSFFSVSGQLYAGNAVVFACDDVGETVSLDKLPPILWFKDASAAELAIQRGDVMRPQIKYGDVVHWQWNVTEEAPDADARR